MSFDAGLNQLTTAVLQGGTTVMIEFRFGREIVRQLHDSRWYIIEEVRTDDGGIFAINIDVTELKSAQDAADD